MNTAIEGIYLKEMIIPFFLIMLFTAVVIIITVILVGRELDNEKND